MYTLTQLPTNSHSEPQALVQISHALNGPSSPLSSPTNRKSGLLKLGAGEAAITRKTLITDSQLGSALMRSPSMPNPSYRDDHLAIDLDLGDE